MSELIDWRTVPGYPAYLVSSDGRVRSMWTPGKAVMEESWVTELKTESGRVTLYRVLNGNVEKPPLSITIKMLVEMTHGKG